MKPLKDENDTTRVTLSRRDLLAGATASVAGAALAGASDIALAAPARPGAAAAQAPGRWQHGGRLAQRGVDVAAKAGRDKEGRFGLMFKKLDAFAPPDDALVRLARSMSDSGGSPDRVEPLDNPLLPSGFTFLGQFVDHDMTFDQTPLSAQEVDPRALTNFDTPRFDLASVYGKGPQRSPELYDPRRAGRLLLVQPHGFDDLPRRDDGRAYVGDPRNDENLIVCQLQIAFIRFHNRLMDGGLSFAEAQKLTRWHFQWILVHDFLPHVVGQETVDRFLVERGGLVQCRREHYKPRNPRRPMMPIEYSAAAYRFGHSMIRGGYLLNASVGAPTFLNPPSDGDLHGSRAIPPGFEIDWREFFAMPGTDHPPHNLARRIDPKLAFPLHHLPPSVVPTDVAPVIPNLAERNLLRGKYLGLPAGQDVARAIGVPALSNADLGLADPALGGKAPLWFYVLAEAERQEEGLRLGQVGGRIVAETILGILDADRDSYFHARGWAPDRPIARSRGRFLTGDLLAFAGRV